MRLPVPLIHPFALIALLLCFRLPTTAQRAEDLSSLIAVKKGYKTYPIPKGKLPASEFTIMEPGLAILSLDGGLYIPAIKTWLILPNGSYIVSSDQFLSTADTAFEVLKLNLRQHKTLLQTVKDPSALDSVSSLCNLPFGYYHLRIAANHNTYIWGKSEGRYKVFLYNSKGLFTVYSSNRAIHDVELMNPNNLLLAEDSLVRWVSLNQSPRSMLRVDMNIDGIALDNDGSLFVSTARGIIHFYSIDKGDFDVITRRIHGRIRVYRNRLFVLWQDKSEFVEIKLK